MAASGIPANASAVETKKKPPTTVVFPDFRRDRPLVRLVSDEEFVLLLTSGSDKVRVVATPAWRGTGADLVLSVTRDPEWAESRICRWKVRVHPSTPRNSKVSENGEQIFPEWIESGEHLSFSFYRKVDNQAWDFPDRVFQMILFPGKGEANVSRVSKPSELDESGNVVLPPKSLMELPEDILRMVLEHLPSECLLKSVAPVSQELFRLVKTRPSWPSLTISCDSLADCRALCEQAGRSCENLTLKMFSPHQIEDHVQIALVEYRWPKLRTLQLSGLNSDVLRHLLRAIREGHFPALEEIHLDSLSRALMLSSLQVFTMLPTLRVLSFSLSSIEGIGNPVDLEKMFPHPFPKLEVLKVTIDGQPPSTPILPLLLLLLRGGKLPNLKELKYEGKRVPTMITGHEEPDWITQHTGLESLALDFKSFLSIDERPIVEVDWVFVAFPNLKSLIFESDIGVTWTSISDENLAKLKKLQVAQDLFVAEDLTRVCPFYKLRNLEDLSVPFRKEEEPDDEDQYDHRVARSYLTEILALPSLRRLEIVGNLRMEDLTVAVAFCAQYSPGVTSNTVLEHLHLEFNDECLGTLQFRRLRRIFRFFPNVRHLTLAARHFTAPAAIKEALDVLSRLTQVHLKEKPDEENPDEENPSEQLLKFESRMQELIRRLPEGWERWVPITHDPESAPSFIAKQRRPVPE